MATLARHLQNKGIRLKDPLEAIVNNKQLNSPSTSNSDTDNKSEKSEWESESETESMSEKKVKFNNATDLESSMKKLTVRDQTVSGSIGNPMISGRWDTFNHTSDTKS